MDHNTSNDIVPDNHEGKAVDLQEFVTATNSKDAIAIYTKACERLSDPSQWHELAGTLSASFSLFKNKKNTNKYAETCDYFMIDLPAPKPAAGNGHDWVQLKDISTDVDADADSSFALTVEASVNPTEPENGTAHFFEEGATSTFIIKRIGNKVIASYHGRNEKPNNKDVVMKDKLRNSLIAMGAFVGLSELQWSSLLKGFLSES